MNGKSTRIFSPILKERGVIAYTDSDFLWWGKEKEGKRHKNFTKKKVVFFSPVPCSEFLSGIFAGLSHTWQLCGYETLLRRVLGGRSSEITPSRTWQRQCIRAACGWCLCVCELRYLFFRCAAWELLFLEQGSKSRPDHSWFCFYQNHTYSLRSKLLGMDRL